MIKKYAVKGFIIFVVSGFLYVVMIVFYGIPLHDLNLWILGQRYENIHAYHPQNSVLLEKKKYLGGPDDHGSQQCNYVVGEIRSSNLTKEAIQFAYSGHSIKSLSGFNKIPLEILFFDTGFSWRMEYPWTIWWDELDDRYKNTTSTLYLVYVAVKGYPFLGDYRCDN